MSDYTIYNLVLAGVIVPFACWLLWRTDEIRRFTLAVRISTLVALIGYPWDFFAIRTGVWRHPTDPGVTVYGVPVNDLVFMWLCTLLSSSVLIALRAGQTHSQRHPEGEYASEQDARDQRRRSARLPAPVVE